MGDSTSVAHAAAPLPSSAEIARAEAFTRERFVHEGEEPALALALGTPRRRALDSALAEIKEGADHPSTVWRRQVALLLGLGPVLSEDEPEVEAEGEDLEEDEDDDEEDEEESEDDEAYDRAPPPEDEDEDEDDEPVAFELPQEEEEEEEEEDEDEEEGDAELDEDAVAEQAEDPHAAERFWVEHAT